ncbi:hypothetical protein LIER_37597 [Lithospermum erythrorhizon]|uniref:Reverse transcriptase n=1 Tax=Lithospermum erythrorhizon TaxID=34254 RepID=A0AAV3PMN5_LITER
MRILGDYEKALGQKINVGKCSVSFSSRTPMSMREIMLASMGMREVKDQGKYLGLPSQIGRTKKEIFRYIQSKVEGRIRGWKGKLLSEAGKEVTIKSVTSAIPNFIINCFKLPLGIIDDLNSTMAHFFWANEEGDKSILWKAWDKLC